MKPIGNPNSKVWIVLDYPSRLEAATGAITFSGQTHHLLQVLSNLGFNEDSVFVTSIVQEFPYKGDSSCYFCTKTQAAKNGFQYRFGSYISPKLDTYIKDYQGLLSDHDPDVVFALGDIALLAHDISGSVHNWRGSELHIPGRSGVVIPTYSLHTINRKMDWQFIFQQDFRRGKHVLHRGKIERKEEFIIKPSFSLVCDILNYLIQLADNRATVGRTLLLGVDIETASRFITCIGIAWSSDKAICIPFISADEENVYSFQEELAIRGLLKKLLTHPYIETVGQNFNYDAGKISHLLGFKPNMNHDTMLAWHVAYPGFPKDLGFIASMLLPNYVYWKEEGKGHCPTRDTQIQYWVYNAKDSARTLELKAHLDQLLASTGLTPQYDEQRKLLNIVCDMEMRGVRQNVKLRNQWRLDLQFRLGHYETYFASLTDAITGGIPLVAKPNKKTAPWWRSSTQLNKIFYQIFKLKPQWSRTNKKAKSPSVDDDALKAFAKEEPLLAPLCEKIAEYRSLGVFLSTFIDVRLECDKRLRTSYGIGATETFRFTSGQYDFTFGANLQNIPSGNED